LKKKFPSATSTEARGRHAAATLSGDADGTDDEDTPDVESNGAGARVSVMPAIMRGARELARCSSKFYVAQG
jgi:hypothetical protein